MPKVRCSNCGFEGELGNLFEKDKFIQGFSGTKCPNCKRFGTLDTYDVEKDLITLKMEEKRDREMSGTFKKRPKPPTYPINYTPSVATERYIEEVETFFDGLAKQLREKREEMFTIEATDLIDQLLEALEK